MLPTIGVLRPWADPTQIQIDRLPMHVPFNGFERRMLDGMWSLEMFTSPDAVPATAVTGDRPRAVKVSVPGNWTLQDLGDFVDTPHYTNIQMPFPGPPPRLPERNSTGVYRRSFLVPKAWLRKRVVVHVAGAESVHAVFVNGAFVGYGTDSRLPSEYDISGQARAGSNELAIVVIRYSAHSYIEDQDQWWMAGLHRSVWVEARPIVHIADVPIAVDFDPTTGCGMVESTTVVDFGGEPRDGWSVRSALITPNGRPVGRAQQSSVPTRFAQPYVFRGHQVSATWEVPNALAWSAEQPRTYRVRVELRDPSGVVQHAEEQHIGLKRVEVRDRQLLVNGQPIWVFGVNRHDHHPDRGKAVTVDDMRADLTAMRAHNITAVRTSHYPNDSALLDLCDELGFYVVGEANIESHGYNFSLCNDPRYRDAWLERGARMVQRDRNHASIMLWSLGNESGYGTNHDALAGWIRSADASRPLHYEDAIRVEGWEDGGRAATDVVCPMYAEIASIRDYGASGVGDRPLILCEYSHAMGNSNGSLADYWDTIVSTPGLQGGFIWEWKDHGLRQRLEDGTVRLAYGGQFGDTPNDGNFVADGLMSADLVPHPAMREVAWVHRPVIVSKVRNGLEIDNRQSFLGLDWLRARWELIVDGEVQRRGSLDVPKVAPRTAVVMPLPCEVPPEGSDGRLTVRWEARRAQWWCEPGHLVAWDQVMLRDNPVTAPSAGRPLPSSVRVEPRLNLWRAATDNDGFKLMPELAQRLRVGGQGLRQWLAAGVDHRPAEELVEHTLSVTDSEHGRTYRHAVHVPVDLADLPRIGAIFTLPARFTKMRWFGRGPHENYPDRNRSAMLGVWESPLDDSPYLVPQEFGLRTDCRWYELIDERAGDVVRIDAVQPHALHVSATRYFPTDLYAATTATDLRPRREVVVCIDVAHRGLGTASCGPDVLPQYRIGTGSFEFAYRISAS